MIRTESNSSVNTYKTCPAKYRFHYGPNKRYTKATEAMQLGNLVHESFAHSLQGNATTQEALDYAATAFTYADVQKKGKAVIEYYAPLIGFDGKIIAVPGMIENKFNVEIEGVRVLGYIDAIIEDQHGNYVLVDWKTRGQLLDSSQVAMDSQLYVYAYVTQHVLGIQLDRVCQVQMKTTLPAKPKLIKSGALSKTLGLTTRSVFMNEYRRLDVHVSDKELLNYSHKFVDESEFLRMSYIDMHRVTPQTNKFIGWVKRIQEDNQMLPVNNAPVCKWCQYTDLCLEG